MGDPLARLDEAADAINRRMGYELANRLGLLRVHAVVGLWAGPLMLLFGSATTIEAAIGVWTRTVLGLLALAGGLLLAIGISRTPRSIRLEAAGLALLLVWDTAMMLGIIYARISQGDFAVRPLFDPLPLGYVVAYPIPVYAGYGALLTIHLLTLRKLRKANH